MGKNKLRKFAEMEHMDCVLQYPFAVVRAEGGFPLRGKWRERFGNDNPIVLELGCGKGEYTVGLARLNPDKNFIGIDIKGARMYTGAKIAEEEDLKNVAFLRTSIELLPHFFAPGEVSEIWITFPDPQMKKVRKRLTATNFLDLYRQVLCDGGLVHLKTDSPFLYTYTDAMLQASGIEPVYNVDNLYGTEGNEDGSEHLDAASVAGLKPVIPIPNMRTHYEQQWLERGLTIKFLSFPLRASDTLAEPEIDIEPDAYRSYSRRSDKINK
ncbi:MAG: tRNA (guanosine(46)-N7)-methyltransferase TrmB [Bacteroidales bacterium]|nr:tRNA (guanosine(46)-N7)-methyltransferase TrmB [Bacteroidales bacterium]